MSLSLQEIFNLENNDKKAILIGDIISNFFPIVNISNKDKHKIFPEYLILVTKDFANVDISKFKNQIAENGFKVYFNLLDQNAAKDKLFKNKEKILKHTARYHKNLSQKIEDFIAKSESEEKEPTIEKNNNGENFSWNLLNLKQDKILEITAAREFIIYSISFLPLTPKEFNKSHPTPLDPDFSYSKYEKLLSKKKKIGLFLLSILLYGCLIWILYQIIYSSDETTLSSFAFSFDENGSTVNNFFYLCIGLSVFVIVRESIPIFIFKMNHEPIQLPYLFNLNISIENYKTPNKLFDISFSRLISGFTIALILLVIGLSISYVIPTEEIYYGYYNEYEENLNQYNLLFQIIQNLFFNFPNKMAEFSYGHSSNVYLLPEYTILVHPIAYAGYLGLLFTFVSIIPLIYLDGGKILLTISRNSKLFCISGVIFAIIFIINFRYEMLYVGIMILVLSTNATSKLNIFQLDNYKYPLYEISKNRKILAIFLIIIMILTIPLSLNMDFYGFSF